MVDIRGHVAHIAHMTANHSRTVSTGIGVDLEQWRIAQGKSYRALQRTLGISDGVTIRDYALGIKWPGTDKLEVILRQTNGGVTVDAMHRRRCAYLQSIGKLAPLVSAAE
jgi:hypothetical protein